MAKRIFQLALIGCLLVSELWAANDHFIGKWKLNPSRSKLTDEMKVKSVGENKYAFDFGSGKPETVVADGTDQRGNFGSTLSVTVEGPSTWKLIRKKDGRTMITATWKLSEDGNTLTDHFTGIQPNGTTFSLDYVYKRTAGTGFRRYMGEHKRAAERASSFRSSLMKATVSLSSVLLRKPRGT